MLCPQDTEPLFSFLYYGHNLKEGCSSNYLLVLPNVGFEHDAMTIGAIWTLWSADCETLIKSQFKPPKVIIKLCKAGNISEQGVSRESCIFIDATKGTFFFLVICHDSHSAYLSQCRLFLVMLKW